MSCQLYQDPVIERTIVFFGGLLVFALISLAIAGLVVWWLERDSNGSKQ